MKGLVNMTQVSIAAEVESVIVALAVNLSDWERSQSAWLPILLDIW